MTAPEPRAAAADLKWRDREQHHGLNQVGRRIWNRRPVEADPQHVRQAAPGRCGCSGHSAMPHASVTDDVAGERQHRAQHHVQEPREGRRTSPSRTAPRRRSRPSIESQSRVTDRQNQTRPRSPASSIRSPTTDAARSAEPTSDSSVSATTIPTHAHLPGERAPSAAADRRAARGRRRGRRAP